MTNRLKEMERKSSAITLSDMEMFIFPELIYGLVLANIMSPVIWRWRDDSWFAGLARMKPYRRISRLKQYIMDHYLFNLDLDTWGLTGKKEEMARFNGFISEEMLKESNALFGYEGDRYYFDLNIRSHFGLDKYEGDTIPYWKTETIEAMDAFCHKPNYLTGAGECVSLAALYAAALFIVARIPLQDIYLMATPLHSQNFIDIDDGILTNNRRLVTKNMWFNGTALSAQARRALENERVTIVAHESGFIHTVYHKATINAQIYDHFRQRLQSYLKVRLSEELLGNYLRHSREVQKCFQVKWSMQGTDNFIGAERVFAYEHGSPYRINDNTRDKLMDEIDREEFRPVPIPGRIVLNEFEEFLRKKTIDINNPGDIMGLKTQFASGCMDAKAAIEGLAKFSYIEPGLPAVETKKFVSDQEPLGIDLEMTREEIIDRLEAIRELNDTADLAFHAYRDLNRTKPEPFLIAALERNPVSIAGAKELETEKVIHTVSRMPDESIYEGLGRLAQPDEVWNYGRGDGIEKAVLLANLLKNRMPKAEIIIKVFPNKARLVVDGNAYDFHSQKGIEEQTWIVPVC